MSSRNKKSGRELQSIQENLEYSWKILKVFLIDIMPKTSSKDMLDMDYRMLELENLVSTFGWLVVLKKIQKRWIPDYRTYIWSWKLDEIVLEMKESWADLLIFWNMLKRHQIYNINEKLREIWAKAWDRVDLILKIFEKNAKSAEAKLQIELAAIKHMWPRIYGMWMELSKQWWWVWSRWKWETNTEIMKRHLSLKEESIKEELDKYKKVRELHRKSRKRSWLPTIWIVWYTNAWKSSLLNILTSKWVLSEDKLFATLWTSVWKLWLETKEIPEKLWITSSEKIVSQSLPNKEAPIEKFSLPRTSRFWEISKNQVWKYILLNDTIWFIRDLPPNLIKAFSSTLEDSIESDLIFHVVDASDPKIEDKIKIVDDILEKIWAKQDKLYVFNKTDLVENLDDLKEKFEYLNPIYISTYNKFWIDELKDYINKYF